MIRIRHSHNGAVLLNYFLRDPSLTEAERQGVWCGRACEPLGLGGGDMVRARDFALMLDGYDARGRQFMQRRYSSRRVAYDMVVSAAKSISIAALCWESGAVVRECFAAASRGLVAVAERFARRQGRVYQRLKTGTVAAATFVHDASRYGDPHLHAHLVMGNVTWDGAFWTLGAEGMYQNHMTLDGIFQRDLAWRLSLAGLRAELRNGVAVLPVAEELCRRLSRGRNAIEEVVERLGVSGPRKKALEQVLNDRLRPVKKTVDRHFDRMLTAAERRELRNVRGKARLARQEWDDLELWRYLRGEIRTHGFETERARWNVALRASLRDVGRPIDEFLDVALDRGLMAGSAERGVRARARRGAPFGARTEIVARESESASVGVRL